MKPFTYSIVQLIPYILCLAIFLNPLNHNYLSMGILYPVCKTMNNSRGDNCLGYDDHDDLLVIDHMKASKLEVSCTVKN